MPHKQGGKQKVGRIGLVAPLFPNAAAVLNPSKAIPGTSQAVTATSGAAAATSSNKNLMHAAEHHQQNEQQFQQQLQEEPHKLINHNKLCNTETLKILDSSDLMLSLKTTLDELAADGTLKGTPAAIVEYRELAMLSARLLFYEEMCKSDQHYSALPPPSPPPSAAGSASTSRKNSTTVDSLEEEAKLDSVHMLKGELGRCNVVRNARGDIEHLSGAIWYAAIDNRRELTVEELREHDRRIQANTQSTMQRDFLRGQLYDGKLVEQVTFPEDFNIDIMAKSFCNAEPRDWLVQMRYCDFDGVPLSQKLVASEKEEEKVEDDENMEPAKFDDDDAGLHHSHVGDIEMAEISKTDDNTPVEVKIDHQHHHSEQIAELTERMPALSMDAAAAAVPAKNIEINGEVYPSPPHKQLYSGNRQRGAVSADDDDDDMDADDESSVEIGVEATKQLVPPAVSSIASGSSATAATLVPSKAAEKQISAKSKNQTNSKKVANKVIASAQKRTKQRSPSSDSGSTDGSTPASGSSSSTTSYDGPDSDEYVKSDNVHDKKNIQTGPTGFVLVPPTSESKKTHNMSVDKSLASIGDIVATSLTMRHSAFPLKEIAPVAAPAKRGRKKAIDTAAVNKTPAAQKSLPKSTECLPLLPTNNQSDATFAASLADSSSVKDVKKVAADISKTSVDADRLHDSAANQQRRPRGRPPKNAGPPGVKASSIESSKNQHVMQREPVVATPLPRSSVVMMPSPLLQQSDSSLSIPLINNKKDAGAGSRSSSSQSSIVSIKIAAAVAGAAAENDEVPGKALSIASSSSSSSSSYFSLTGFNSVHSSPGSPTTDNAAGAVGIDAEIADAAAAENDSGKAGYHTPSTATNNEAAAAPVDSGNTEPNKFMTVLASNSSLSMDTEDGFEVTKVRISPAWHAKQAKFNFSNISKGGVKAEDGVQPKALKPIAEDILVDDGDESEEVEFLERRTSPTKANDDDNNKLLNSARNVRNAVQASLNASTSNHRSAASVKFETREISSGQRRSRSPSPEVVCVDSD